MSDSYDRPIWQIALKTIVTHACAIFIYAQYNNLLHVPAKHNARLFRLVLFACVPTILIGQYAFDIVKAALRALQNPHELDLSDGEMKDSLRFYWDGVLGVRSVPAATDDEEPQQREQPIRLLDLASPTDVQPPKRVWTWKQTIQLVLTLLATAQALAVVVLFARRMLHSSCRQKLMPCHESPWQKCEAPEHLVWFCSHSTVALDLRNLYIASASIIAAVFSIYLLVKGDTWTGIPALGREDVGEARVAGLMGEMKRLAMDFILGAFMQELIASECYWRDDGMPDYPTSLVHLLSGIRLRLTEWILLIIVAAMLAIFRNDIVFRLGIKVSPAYFFKVFGGIALVVVMGWFVVDAVGVVVTDIGHFVAGEYKEPFGEGWMDPVERWVPFI